MLNSSITVKNAAVRMFESLTFWLDRLVSHRARGKGFYRDSNLRLRDLRLRGGLRSGIDQMASRQLNSYQLENRFEF